MSIFFRRLSTLALLSGFLLCATTSAAPVQEAQKSVLLIYDLRSDMLGNTVVERAIRKALNDEFSFNLDIRNEYFDTAPLSNEDYQILRAWLRRKYSGKTFDVVVPVGAAALQFVQTYGDDLFRNAQVVFWGRKGALERWTSDKPVTGVVVPDMDKHVGDTFAFIRALQPDLEELAVVSGTGFVDRNWESAARHQQGSFNKRVRFTYLAGMSLEKMEAYIATLTPKAAVLVLSVNEDGAGRQLLRTQFLAKFVMESAAPVYSTSAIYLETGIVGGALVNQEAMAVAAAGLISRLLRGESIKNLPVQELPPVPMANWAALKRWHLNADKLPRGTIITNKERSVWDEYRWRIFAAVSLCVLQSSLIVALLINRAHRRRAEKAMSESKDQLRKAHDAQLRLTDLLMRAQEDERRRIARDLHDVTVQNMVAIKSTLDGAAHESHMLTPGTAEMVHESLSLCDEIMREIRTLSYVLHPPFLDEAGLVPALRWFVRGFIQRSDIKVQLALDDVGRLPAEVETALFRVVQESLTNIHRHSGSNSAAITLKRDQTNVILRITDSGRGFSQPGTSKGRERGMPPGVGIQGMRQRMRQLGGQLELESSDQGTCVSAKVEISEEYHAYLSSR